MNTDNSNAKTETFKMFETLKKRSDSEIRKALENGLAAEQRGEASPRVKEFCRCMEIELEFRSMLAAKD
jgi:hypothetical protein